MSKSKADIVMEKQAGVGSAIWSGLKYIGKGIASGLGYGAKKTTQAAVKTVKKNPVATTAVVTAPIATYYSLKARNKAREDLQKHMNTSALYSADNQTDFDKTINSQEFKDALITPKQKEGIAKLPKEQQAIHRAGVDTHNQTRLFHSLTPSYHKAYPGDVNYVDSLNTVGALDNFQSILPKNKRK